MSFYNLKICKKDKKIIGEWAWYAHLATDANNRQLVGEQLQDSKFIKLACDCLGRKEVLKRCEISFQLKARKELGKKVK